MPSAQPIRFSPLRWQGRGLRPRPDALDHDRGADRRRRRRHPRPRRRAGRLGGADGGRAGRRDDALRLDRRRGRHRAAPPPRAAAGRAPAGRHQRGQRRLHPRPPQRRAGAGRPERCDAPLPPRGRRPLLDRLRSGARRRRARHLQRLSVRGAAAGDLREPRRRRPRQRHSGDRRPLAAAARQRAGGKTRAGEDQRLGAGPVRRGAGRHRGEDAGCDRAAAGARRRGGDRHPRRAARPGAARRTRPGSWSRPASSEARARAAATR